MDVLLILALAGLISSVYLLFNKASNLKRESDHLSELLVATIKDHEQALSDHMSAERELAIIKAKLEGIQSSSFTPDNSISKSMHIEKMVEMSNSLVKIQEEVVEITKKYEESRGKQKSEQVRLGQIGEQFATLHNNFKYDRKETKALLQPVDFVCFEENEVVFVDIKTGDAGLSTKQRKIRDNIRAGRVRWEVFRINENGANWEE